jgi:hypothetical protein
LTVENLESQKSEETNHLEAICTKEGILKSDLILTIVVGSLLNLDIVSLVFTLIGGNGVTYDQIFVVVIEENFLNFAVFLGLDDIIHGYPFENLDEIDQLR